MTTDERAAAEFYAGMATETARQIRAEFDVPDHRPTGPDCPNACEDGAHVENCPTLTGQRPETDAKYEALYGKAETLPETCDECETRGVNCSLHRGPEWTDEEYG